MNKKNILPLTIFSVISWASFILVMIFLEPCSTYSNVEGLFCQTPSTLGQLLFYFSIFFALTCTYTIIGYFSRIWTQKMEVYSNFFNISLRQGILLAFTTIGILVFLSLDILKWWTTLILLITVILIEFNFLSREI
jgi:hypothetical protein